MHYNFFGFNHKIQNPEKASSYVSGQTAFGLFMVGTVLVIMSVQIIGEISEMFLTTGCDRIFAYHSPLLSLPLWSVVR